MPLTLLTDGATCPTTAALPDGSFLVVWSPGGIGADDADGRRLATWQGPGPDGEELFARLLVDE